MNLYHAWFNLKDGVRDRELVAALDDYLGQLEARGLLAGWRLTRRKLGLGPRELPEFHLIMEFESLAQLDRAFGVVSTRAEPIEGLHHAVNAKVADITFALYRDFPDPQRRTGEERF